MANAAETTENTAERTAFNSEVGEFSLAPLWDQYHGLLTPEPEVKSVPHIWRFAQMRGLLHKACDLLTAKEAERRVLMLENPSYQGDAQITETLFSGLQAILPGEVAPAHRHSPNALRLVLDGDGAYTSVNGEKTFMHYGDYIITPTMCWHDHGNEGTGPVIWQDILDMPFVRNMGTIFHDSYPEDVFPKGPPEGDSLKRFGNNMVPVGLEPDGMNSPIFHYPFERSRETMESLALTTELDPYFGLKMEFIDPTTGQSAMSSISTFLQRMPKGFKSERYQTTEGQIFTCIEGGGRVIIEGRNGTETIEFTPKDIFVVPSWYPYQLEVDDDSYLFVGTDKIIQEKFGLFRERRGNA